MVQNRERYTKLLYGITLLNLYVGHVMRNAGLQEREMRIKTAGRKINNLRYADGATLMTENEYELKNLPLKIKEDNAKIGLILNIKALPPSKMELSPSTFKWAEIWSTCWS